MADVAPVPSSAASSNSSVLITSLNDNDVILGRGAGPSQYIGNLRFRSHIKKRQEEYIAIATHRHESKARISRDIVSQIHALGGRFLKAVESESSLGSGMVWYEEVADMIALDKCKQSFRDYRKKQGPSDEKDTGNDGEKGGGDEKRRRKITTTRWNETLEAGELCRHRVRLVCATKLS
jgi:hypothetical protein